MVSLAATILCRLQLCMALGGWDSRLSGHRWEMFTVLLLHKKDVQALLIVNEKMIQKWVSLPASVLPYVLLVFFRWMLTGQCLVAAFKVASLKFKCIPIFVTPIIIGQWLCSTVWLYVVRCVTRVALGQAKGHNYTSNYSHAHCLHCALPSEPTLLIV